MLRMKTYYRSGELARLAGLSTDTLRHYERLGLIARARRSSNGYREYDTATLQRIHVIQAAISIGFTLRELVKILQMRDGGGAPCREVHQLAKSKLSQLEERIRQMKAMRKQLCDVITDWDVRLQAIEPGSRAGLLDHLAADPKIKNRRKK